MIYSLYRGLTTITGPMINHYLKKRLARGKEHPTRFPERRGQASIARPLGKMVWLHGASVGEAISLLPLIDEIQKRYPTFNVMITTGTITSAALMEKRLPEGVIHQFVPVDRLPYVRAFLDHWQPDYAIWAESELWPNLVVETKKRGVKMALVNARMSDKSLATWQKLKGFIQTLLGCFDLCLAQTEKDALRYQQLGAQHVESFGNLKYASPDLPCDEEELVLLRKTLEARPLWLAASTHNGEEVMMGRVHQALKTQFPNLLTLIAPRHPERGSTIVSELKELGLSVAQRSQKDELNPQTDVYVADTLGELGLFYRLSPLVFMGKSMEPLGGQNPLEAARLDCALICGPYMTNFEEMMERFIDGKAISIVADEPEIAAKLTELFRDEKARDVQAANAKIVAYMQAAVLGKTMTALQGLLGKGEG
ncbi:3-deoxy-D-manno-octulosonic-acid transferase [Candidatus Terasakiella magnetica]|uniref:3-deoxy-D-manno-octulosonic acid transferase n=1 Tax=Candidatus Terasakiella magnetica TaxID=1867952 RepID=A0A1C3REZ0_9PROT|nr:3-deoxy-D-manno-octulosonic acid transferase [Candidatus Terasakiella magnetica]SCA55856.1 3-deoxy-D-manno-octulosonic-acid transferase [Candidatus Terasakiella magnetica]